MKPWIDTFATNIPADLKGKVSDSVYTEFERIFEATSAKQEALCRAHFEGKSGLDIARLVQESEAARRELYRINKKINSGVLR